MYRLPKGERPEGRDRAAKTKEVSMLRKFLFVAALALLPAIANAQPRAQDWEITLGGSGSNNRGFTQADFAVNGSIGYFFTPQLEVSLRQGISYADHNNGTDWLGNTRGAVDYHFTNLFGKFVPYVGANVGYAYGENFNDTWEAAPEAGLKFYVHERTFLFVQGEYQFFFRNGGGAGEGFKHGQFIYSLGIGFNLP